MDKETFALRLEEATERVLIFTRRYVLDELPNAVLYLITPNASYDAIPFKFDEEVFPQDGMLTGQTHLPTMDAEGVVDFLWRNGKVPVWINIKVSEVNAEHSFLSLVCSGRYTAGDGLYRPEGPFHLLGPSLPPEWAEGRKKWSLKTKNEERETPEQLAEKFGKFPLPKHTLFEDSKL